MSRKKILLIVIALALIGAGVFLLLRKKRANYLERVSLAGSPDGSFIVQVERPVLSGRPIWEAPRAILGNADWELRFGNKSPGAAIGAVSPTRLELRADGGWDLLIQSDGQGRVMSGTRLVFTLPLFDRELKLNCRPADSDGIDHFNTTPRPGSDRVDGDFYLYLTQCKNAVSLKNTAGLPAFTVRGRFKGLTQSTNVTGDGKGTK